jgi:hypothetical protein
LHTGAVLFNKGADEMMILDTEVAALEFFMSQGHFWYMASCWEGRVAFFTQPILQKGKEYV